jgi:hypothetical protein
MMKPMKLCLLAITSVALLTASAHAATISASAGDLVLGFRATGGTGSGYNLEVDLGSVKQFYAGTNLTLSVSGQDLTDIYGTWYGRTDLYWGAAASYSTSSTVDGKIPSTFWITARTNTATSYAPLANTSGAQSGPASKIIAMYTGGDGALNGQTSTTNSTNAARIDNTLPGAWSVQAGSSRNFFYDDIAPERAISGTKTLALYELDPTDQSPRPKGTLLGNLTLGSDGSLNFQAIPEPSTWMLVAAGLGMSMMINRRRKA